MDDKWQLWSSTATYRRVLLAIMDIAKCHNCAKVPSDTQSQQCHDGHVMCSECIRDGVSCTCKKKLLSTRSPYVFNQLLSCLPRTCRHPGCDHLVPPNHGHEQFCRKNPVSLKCPMCKVDLIREQEDFYRRHFKDEHHRRYIADKKLAIKVKRRELKTFKDAWILDAHSELFYVMMENSKITVSIIQTTPEFKKRRMFATAEILYGKETLFTASQKLGENRRDFEGGVCPYSVSIVISNDLDTPLDELLKLWVKVFPSNSGTSVQASRDRGRSLSSTRSVPHSSDKQCDRDRSPAYSPPRKHPTFRIPHVQSHKSSHSEF